MLLELVLQTEKFSHNFEVKNIFHKDLRNSMSVNLNTPEILINDINYKRETIFKNKRIKETANA